jgi:hypothetical protein
MNREGPHRERDPRQFEKGREVHEEQTRNISEEDRRQWEKTRDIRKEASEIPEETPTQHERDDRLEAPPGD